MFEESIFLYGPPGSGKSTVGLRLAGDLNLTFYDLDSIIETNTGVPIPHIFESEGERGFRAHEKRLLKQVIENSPSVIALGGGALLDSSNRSLVESNGPVVCLGGSVDILAERLSDAEPTRPLLAGDRSKLDVLLEKRAGHYKSFPLQIETDQKTIEEISWSAQVMLGKFFIRGMGDGYPVEVRNSCLAQLGQVCNYMGLSGPIVVVSDSNVAPLYADSAIESLETAGYKTKLHVIPAGETYKTMRTVEDIWDSLLNAHLERSSTVIALGGGVTGDITGFAAATYLRGLNWVCVPTSVLAMVDASLGGKTGIDHNRGKNLIGAFYPPRFVLVDPEVLGTLPEEEIRSGMAEVIKHGVIGDPKLFDLCRQNPDRDVNSFPEIIRRAMAVKVKVLLLDPFEKDIRATLNFGHTLGHGIEKASEYTIRHGEAVSIGMVAATKLAERLDTAANGLSDELIDVLMRNGLPISIPKTISKEKALEAIRVDKKRKAGKIPLVLPVQIGEVKFGFEIDDINQLFDD